MGVFTTRMNPRLVQVRFRAGVYIACQGMLGTTVAEVALGEHRRDWSRGEELYARAMRSQWEIIPRA